MNQVNYITTKELGKVIDNWIKANPHNSGYAEMWEVINPKDSAYPEIEEYFLNQGLNIGDKVLIHSYW